MLNNMNPLEIIAEQMKVITEGVENAFAKDECPHCISKMGRICNHKPCRDCHYFNCICDSERENWEERESNFTQL